MTDLEQAVPGWEAIAFTLDISLRSAYRRREELKQAGVIFYIRKGKPPKKVVYHFPSRLKAWTGLKANKNETI